MKKTPQKTMVNSISGIRESFLQTEQALVGEARSAISAEDRLAAAKLIVRMANDLCEDIEYLYKIDPAMVRAVASEREFFPLRYTDIPFEEEINGEGANAESKGGELREWPFETMRRALKLATQPLSGKRKGKGRNPAMDPLRKMMGMFTRAILNQQHAITVKLTMPSRQGERPATSEFVSRKVRDRLLRKNARYNARIWAVEFTNWIQAERPWVVIDPSGPLHNFAKHRLKSRQKYSVDEKSPWNAFRAVVRERFKSQLHVEEE